MTTRRNFLIGAASLASLVGVASAFGWREGGVRGLLFGASEDPAEPFDALDQLLLSKLDLVISPNHVAHHPKFCAAHLPKNPLAICTDKITVHPRMRVRMLEELAANSTGAEAASLLTTAIALSPAGVHLYDQLTRVLGKMGQYDTIHATLSSAVDQLANQLQQLKPGTSANKHTQKALALLQDRASGAQKKAAQQKARLSKSIQSAEEKI